MLGILYFSSTGNSLYIAQKVQSRMGGTIKYIPHYEGDGSEFEKIILVTPIYSYGMPTFVYDIIPKLNKTSEFIVIQNYGGMVGGADCFMYQYATEQGLNIKAVYVLKMPENFTLTFTVPKLYVRHTLKKRMHESTRQLTIYAQGDIEFRRNARRKAKPTLKTNPTGISSVKIFPQPMSASIAGNAFRFVPQATSPCRTGKLFFQTNVSLVWGAIIVARKRQSYIKAKEKKTDMSIPMCLKIISGRICNSRLLPVR